MNEVNLRQLEVLAAVVEYGSFTEAGNRLYLAQSTVSSHIRGLEEALHVVLFRRESKRRVLLTPEGKRVYQYAREILSSGSVGAGALFRAHDLPGIWLRNPEDGGQLPLPPAAELP